MASLEQLLKDLERALEIGDLDQVASVRRTIADAAPDVKEGAEAWYKLGLDALFRKGDRNVAAECFRSAAKAKIQPWSSSARVSLGLVLASQEKHQQAAFELRKAIGALGPSLLQAQAFGLLVVVLRQGKQGAEAERARKEHMALLARIASLGSAESPSASYLLALEYKFDGNRTEARRLLEAALGSGLGEPERGLAMKALAEV